MPAPLFISFEGGEGAGKTTQAEALLQRLLAGEVPAELVHEPGTTTLGWHLREYLKSNQPLTGEAELLLFEAARAELVNRQVGPALARGTTVIADRFEASTVAYQGYARGIDRSIIHRLNEFATGGVFPTITFLLDLDPEQGLVRAGRPQLSQALMSQVRSPGTEEQRRFEDETLAFHSRVRRGFIEQARANPERWVVIDASRSTEEVGMEVWRHVMGRLKGED